VFDFESEGEQEKRMDQTPSQPQWTPPPQQPAGWGAPGYGGPPPRPTGVTLAAIFLIVMGSLMALAGAACGLLGGAASSGAGQDASGLLGFFGGFLLIAGLIMLVLGILSIAAGAGALGGKSWARWLGVVVSVLFVIFGIFGLLGALNTLNDPNGGGVSSLVFLLVITVAYALTAWALIKASAYFSYRR
jgi:hypothetical protein